MNFACKSQRVSIDIVHISVIYMYHIYKYVSFVFKIVVETDKQNNVSKGELMVNDQDAMEVG